MNTDRQTDAREVNTFEEYTLYSLDRSTPALLQMIDTSKRVAQAWPDTPAVAVAASLCREVAALACFQDSLAEAIGEIEGDAGTTWNHARGQLSDVMKTFEDVLDLNDPDTARLLFSAELPEALCKFIDCVPGLHQHVQSTFMTNEDPSDNGDAIEDAP